MGFAHGLGFPPSFDLFAECKGALSLGSLQAPTPEALFYGLSASIESPVGPGSTVSKQRSPPFSRSKEVGLQLIAVSQARCSSTTVFCATATTRNSRESWSSATPLPHVPAHPGGTGPLSSVLLAKPPPPAKLGPSCGGPGWPSPTENFGLVLKRGLGNPDPPLKSRARRGLKRGSPPPRPVPRPQLRVLGQSAGGQ